MIKKLFQLVQDKSVVEGVDCLMMHELVLGGHLYLQLMKEKMALWLTTLKQSIMKKAKSTTSPQSFELNPHLMEDCLRHTIHLERMFENFLGTGNLPSSTGLGLMQNKGLTIMAENINRMRYMSHFRAIHRGSFFAEMRTTEVRALLPDAWGFVCPVHTPDGSPCGLLNHLAYPVEVLSHVPDVSRIPEVLHHLGLIALDTFETLGDQKEVFEVLLDGKMMGWVEKNKVKEMENKLRILKINEADSRVPKMTE